MKHSSPLPVPPKLLADYLDEAVPPTWRQFRSDRRAAYDELCSALNRRQRGLCAFCENDLVTSVTTPAREIEHWRPKSLDQPPSVRWTFGVDNLQMSCLGGSKRHPVSDVDRTGDPEPGPNLSCGAKKGGSDPDRGFEGVVPYRPQDMPESPAMFTVADDGALAPIADCARHGLDADRLRATIGFLGLNCTRLKIARRTIRASLDRALQAYVDAADGDSDDERFDLGFETLARDTAPPDADDLPRFVTTLRSFFGSGLDGMLLPRPGWSIKP